MGRPVPSRTLVIATGHALSLAIGEDGAVLAEHHQDIGLGHAEALMPALAALLAPFGGGRTAVASIVVETGPGSFTGLRIGHAAASALALAWGAPLVGVRSTLLVAAEMADQARNGRLAVGLDAPRGQVWAERFAMPALDSLEPPIALAPEQLAQWQGGDVLVRNTRPRAAVALAIASRLFSPAVPLYVRQHDDARIA